jgi:hypothetical protein
MATEYIDIARKICGYFDSLEQNEAQDIMVPQKQIEEHVASIIREGVYSGAYDADEAPNDNH